MARILVVLTVLVAGAGVAAAAVLARGSDAAAAAGVVLERPALGPASVPGPPPLSESVVTVQRTFVSTAGDDTNPCSAAEPCRSFATAIANTTAGGEVLAIDSGGYGVFTVDKSLTVAGVPGAHVAITAFTAAAITVNAGSSDKVVLRNLYLTGLGGQTGIFYQAGGSLSVESVVASGFTARGLAANAADGRLVVRDSVFRHNGLQGVFVLGSVWVEIADSRADRNGQPGFSFGNAARGSIVRSISTGNGGNSGIYFDTGSLFAVSDSVVDGNGIGVIVFGAGTRVTLSRVALSNNTDAGLLTGFGSPVARIGGSTVTGNGAVGGLANSEGTLETFGDNIVRGNATETSGTITAVGKT